MQMPNDSSQAPTLPSSIRAVARCPTALRAGTTNTVSARRVTQPPAYDSARTGWPSMPPLPHDSSELCPTAAWFTPRLPLAPMTHPLPPWMVCVGSMRIIVNYCIYIIMLLGLLFGSSGEMPPPPHAPRPRARPPAHDSPGIRRSVVGRDERVGDPDGVLVLVGRL